MNKNIKSIITVITTIFIVGCGNNNHSNTTKKDSPTQVAQQTQVEIVEQNGSKNNLTPIYEEITGRVVDGEIRDAKVFLDSNKNGILDKNETYTTSDNRGYFKLKIEKDNYQTPIVSTGGFDIRENRPYTQTLIAFREKDSKKVILTPISTLIATSVMDKIGEKNSKKKSYNKIDTNRLFSLLAQAKEDIAEVLNLQSEILTKDPIELAIQSGKLDLLEANIKVNKVAKEIQKGIKKDLKEAKKDAIVSFKALAKALKEAKKEAKKGDKALEEAILYIEKIEPDILNKETIPLIKESTKNVIQTFNQKWKENKNDILEVLSNQTDEEPTQLNIDTTPPLIKIKGDNPLILALNSTYTELGAEAIDDEDGIVDVKIVSNNINSAIEGEYQVVYSATDSSKNSSTAVRVIKVVNIKKDNQNNNTNSLNNSNSNNSNLNNSLNNNIIDNNSTNNQNNHNNNTESLTNNNNTGINFNENNNSTSNLNQNNNNHSNNENNSSSDSYNSNNNPISNTYNNNYNNSNENSNSNSNLNHNNNNSANSNEHNSSQNNITNNDSNNSLNNTNESSSNSQIDIKLNGDNPQIIIIGNPYKELGAVAKDSNNNTIEVDINSSDLNISKFGEYKVVYSATDKEGNKAQKSRTVKIISPEILISNLDVLDKSCGDFEDLPIEGSYTLNNNDWGKGNIKNGEDWKQCVFTFSENNSTKGGWFWGWPNGEGRVKGYPEAIYGKKFAHQVNLKGILPKKVKELKSVNIDLEYRDFNITGRYNIAIESWLHKTDNSSMGDIRYEIMVRFDPDGFHPGRRVLFKENVEIDGVIYTVYKKEEKDLDRYFYNFVATKKINKIQFDFKKFLNYLKENDAKTCQDIDELYYNDIEMGVEVINGSGLIILDKFSVDVKDLTLFSTAQKIEENFMKWSGEFSSDTKLDKQIDTSNSNLKWRATPNNLIFRVKNHTLVQKQTKNTNNYLYTIFDNSIDLSKNSAIVKEGSFNKNFYYKIMLYDGTNWCISENNFTGDFFSVKENQKWYLIDTSDDLSSSFRDDSSLPKLKYSKDNECQLDLSSIKGVGVAYFYINVDGNGYFKLDKLSIYANMPKFAIYEGDYEQNSISKLLFGLCMTPNKAISTSQTFIDNFKEWVSYLRWPGGSMIEKYDLQNSGSSVTYSVGKWTEYIKDKIPSMEFLIGVSSSKGAKDNEDVKEYGNGLIKYLNVDYNSSWGDNEALSKPLGLKFVEVGNEPDLEGIDATSYGETLQKYAEGINSADSSVKILGPCTTHGQINGMLPDVLKDYGDYIDIISVHNYTDNPKDYKTDIEIVKGHIEKYMKDNPRRAKKDIKIAFTEYNSLPPATRKGLLYEESWGKVIWHSNTFSYFIKGGLYMSSLWHAYIGGGHATYKRDGTPYPIVSSLKLWRDYIDFDANPKVMYGISNDKDIVITPIEMRDKVVVFVVNGSSSQDKNINIDLINYSGSNRVDITTLTHSITGEYYDKKEVANGVDISRLQELNPDAKITKDDDDKYYIELPKIDIFKQKSSIEVENAQLNYTFPKYSVSVIEYSKK